MRNMRRVVFFLLTVVALFFIGKELRESVWFGTPEPVRLYAEKKAKSSKTIVSHIRQTAEKFTADNVFRKVTYEIEYSDEYSVVVATEHVYVDFKFSGDNYDRLVQFCYLDARDRNRPVVEIYE